MFGAEPAEADPAVDVTVLQAHSLTHSLMFAIRRVIRQMEATRSHASEEAMEPSVNQKAAEIARLNFRLDF